MTSMQESYQVYADLNMNMNMNIGEVSQKPKAYEVKRLRRMLVDLCVKREIQFKKAKHRAGKFCGFSLTKTIPQSCPADKMICSLLAQDLLSCPGRT